MILDIGPQTSAVYSDIIRQSKTIIWNGPLGVYEFEQFSGASSTVAQAVADAAANGASIIIGGGDTIDFHDRYQISTDAYTFVSTGGGAMLEFIGGKDLPALQALLQWCRL